MRRHARQHDTNAIIFRCKVPNCTFKTQRSDKYKEHVKKYHPTNIPPDPPKPLSPLKLTPKTEKSPLKIKTEINETPTTTTVVNLKAEKSHLIKHERPEIRPAARLLTTAASITATPVSIAAPSSGLIRNNSLLTSSPFNTVSPPNKTVSDAYEAMFEDENQFDEALILAAAAASEEEINNLIDDGIVGNPQ